MDRVLGGLTGLEDSLKGCIELLIERSVEIIDPTAEEQPSIAFSVYAHPAPPFEHTLIVPYSLALPSPDAAEKATQLPAAILEVLKCWSDAIEAKLDYEVSSNGWTASGRPPGWRLQPQNRPKERADREADSGKLSLYLDSLPDNERRSVKIRDAAEKFGRSTGYIQSLNAWTLEMNRRAASAAPRKPRFISNPKLDQVAVCKDPQLEQLLRDHQADHEPSPLEDDPVSPRTGRYRGVRGVRS